MSNTFDLTPKVLTILRHFILVLLFLNIIDLILTMIFYYAEINPLVLSLGLFRFILIKVITSLIMILYLIKTKYL